MPTPLDIFPTSDADDIVCLRRRLVAKLALRRRDESTAQASQLIDLNNVSTPGGLRVLLR